MAFQVDISATPGSVTPGSAFLLAWRIDGGLAPLSAVIDNGIGAVQTPSGSVSVTLYTTRVYTITVTDFAGNVVTSSIPVQGCGAASATSGVSTAGTHTAGYTSPQETLQSTNPLPSYFLGGAAPSAGPIAAASRVQQTGQTYQYAAARLVDSSIATQADLIIEQSLNGADFNGVSFDLFLLDLGAQTSLSSLQLVNLLTSNAFAWTWGINVYGNNNAANPRGGGGAAVVGTSGVLGSGATASVTIPLAGSYRYLWIESVRPAGQVTDGLVQIVSIGEINLNGSLNPAPTFPAGLYFLEYQGGAWQAAAGANYQVGPVSVTDGAGNIVDAGLSSAGYAALAAAQAASSGASKAYCHVGGKPIGLYVVSGNYALDVDGSPPLSFRLVGPAPVIYLSASSSSIVAGSAVTLNYQTNSANTSISGVGAVAGPSGTAVVSPTSLTVYTLSDTTDGFTTAPVSVSVVVSALPAPTGLTATGRCGAVDLAWTPPPVYTSFIVLRNGVQIGTPAAPAFTDTPPQPWTDYAYTVQTVNNAVTSAASGSVSAHSFAPLLQVAGVSASSVAGGVKIAWGAAANAVSYNLYRRIAGGAAAIVKSALLGLAAEDRVSADQPYLYSLAAVGPCGEGPRSTEISATALASTLVTDAAAPTTPWTSPPIPKKPWS